MKLSYELLANNINNWIDSINVNLSTSSTPIILTNDCAQIKKDIENIAYDISKEYLFYAEYLLKITKKLFIPFRLDYGQMTVNIAVFGELYVIIKHIISEPINTRFWLDIHPRITSVSKDLYCDGYFAEASEKAIKEVEARMREIYSQARPSAVPPKDATGLINALLSENGLYKFCDTSTKSGENFLKGTKQLFEGAFLAFRNPAMHENINCTQQQAFERIVQASQMMNVLTGGEIRK